MICTLGHFWGRCDDCDARYLAGMNLGDVERCYQQGMISQVQFEGYMYVWASLSPAGSQSEWLCEPLDPAVLDFAEAIFQALCRRHT